MGLDRLKITRAATALLLALTAVCSSQLVWCTSASGHAAVELLLAGRCPVAAPAGPDDSSGIGCRSCSGEECTDVALEMLVPAPTASPSLAAMTASARIAPRAAYVAPPRQAGRLGPVLDALAATVLLS